MKLLYIEFGTKDKSEEDIGTKKKQIFKDVDLNAHHDEAKDTDSDDDCSELSEARIAVKTDLMPEFIKKGSLEIDHL